MPKFYMTDDEIRKDYTKAKDRKRQLGILADMNCVSKAAMRNKLIEMGLIDGIPAEVKPEAIPADQKIDEKRAKALIAGDVSDGDIAREFDVSENAFKSWRRRMGIMRYPKKQQKEEKRMKMDKDRTVEDIVIEAEDRAEERALQESPIEPPVEPKVRLGGNFRIEPRETTDEQMASKLKDADGQNVPGRSADESECVEQVGGAITLSDFHALLHELRQLPWNLGDAKLMINGEIIKDVFEVSICRGSDLRVSLITRC